MDYKGLKICKILEPTFMEDNKVFKVNDVCLGYEANNNIVIVSGDYAGNIYPNIKKSDLKNIDENSYYGWTENINNLKIVFGTNDIIELKDNLETVAIDKMYYIDYEKGVIEPYSFEMPDIFDEEIFEKEEEIKKAVLDRWKGRKQEDDKKRQQAVADKWKTNPNARRDSSQRKQQKGNDRGISR